MAIKGTVVTIPQDTLTDASTVNMELESSFSGNYTLAVFFEVNNDTGTTAGTAKLQQSINGTDYADIGSLSDLTLTDGANVVWAIDATPSVKYRINAVGAGTQSSFLDGQYIFK